MTQLSVLLAVALVTAGLSAQAGSFEAAVATLEGKPAEDTAVVLEPLAATLPPESASAPAIEQRDREFRPYLTIVQTGTAVEFPNRDPFKHHVYSFSPAKIFEIKLYAGKPAQPVVFDKPGEVALGCNIHDWMEAYVLVVNTRHFAKTDAYGHGAILDVPPGRYRLRLWHPRQKAAFPPREIEVGVAPAKLDLVMNIAPRMIIKKPPLESDQY